MSQSNPGIIPEPLEVQRTTGRFELTPDASVVLNGVQLEDVRVALESLRDDTGFALPVGTRGSLVLESHPDRTDLGKEGYELEVLDSSVHVRAATRAGLFYGVQSLRQLLPPQAPFVVPGVRVVDRPRFGWRGAHLDVSRHFMPPSFVKKFIDAMAAHKLNVFHWHLTDDQGWRLEIKKYPRLTEIGSMRAKTLIGHGGKEPFHFDDVPHGGFYTQDEAREIVKYAAERHIAVLPEIEMPGHAQAILAAYPEFGNTGETLEVWDRWGISEHVLNPFPNTMAFLEDVLNEVLEIFPNEYVHIGGDECPKKQWRESQDVQAYMRQHAIPDEHALQSHFIRHVDAFLHARGRRLIGWDEILEGGLSEHATVMSWRGEEGGIEAARAGHDVVMCPQGYVYLDHYQTKDTSQEPLAIGGYTPLEKTYAYDPLPAQLEPSHHHHVLGAQVQHWTEYMPTPSHVERMSFPRLSAFAETIWSAKENKNYPRFLEKLQTHFQRLERAGIRYHPAAHLERWDQQATQP
jgi:hexosaminidase